MRVGPNGQPMPNIAPSQQQLLSAVAAANAVSGRHTPQPPSGVATPSARPPGTQQGPVGGQPPQAAQVQQQIQMLHAQQFVAQQAQAQAQLQAQGQGQGQMQVQGTPLQVPARVPSAQANRAVSLVHIGGLNGIYGTECIAWREQLALRTRSIHPSIAAQRDRRTTRIRHRPDPCASPKQLGQQQSRLSATERDWCIARWDTGVPASCACTACTVQPDDAGDRK